jgi:hypothetical protein
MYSHYEDQAIQSTIHHTSHFGYSHYTMIRKIRCHHPNTEQFYFISFNHRDTQHVYYQNNPPFSPSDIFGSHTELITSLRYLTRYNWEVD